VKEKAVAMILIQNAEIYAPEYLGKKDVLFAGEKICKIADHIAVDFTGLNLQVVNGADKILTPGFIDQHVHVIGAGGEAGFASRTPELQVSNIIRHGITTVVGLHGTDGTARNIEALYAKVCALEAEGITARMLTGSFEMPSATLTGSVRRDMIFIDKVIGAKTAVSDRRSSQPTRAEIEHLAAEAYTGGLVSGKRGYTHIHLGVGERRLDMLMDILRETELPRYLWITTHINREKKLFEQAIDFAKLGGTIDITSGIGPEYGLPEAVKPSEAVRYCLEKGVEIERITMSSDANGSMAVYDEQGCFTGLFVTTVESIYKEFCDLVQKEKLPLETALRVITSNVAVAIGMYPQKGKLQEGSDADLVLMNRALEIEAVYAKGKLASDRSGALLHNVFEHSVMR
jgi:beta-aspartyl-dipeptidase (metallo-type)